MYAVSVRYRCVFQDATLASPTANTTIHAAEAAEDAVTKASVHTADPRPVFYELMSPVSRRVL